MLKNIALGVFEPGQSLLHRLQARTKVLILVMMVLSLVIANQRTWHFAPYIAMTCLVVTGMLLSRLSARFLWQRTWLLLVIAFISGLPIAIYPGDSNAQQLYKSSALLVTYPVLIGVFVLYILIVVCYQWLRRQRWEPLRRPQFQWGLKIARVPLIIIFVVAIAVLTYPMNTFATRGVSVGPLIVSTDGIWTMMVFLVAFLVLYTCSLLVTLTTSPLALMEGITLLLTPLRWLGLPVSDFALMILIALRFIPTLIEEAEQLVKAQAARGAQFGKGPVRERLVSVVALFVPFMRATLRRASELATALEARGYQSEERQTRLHEKAFGRSDFIALMGVALLLVATLLL